MARLQVDVNEVLVLGLLRLFREAGSGINGLWRQKRFALCLCQFLAEGNHSLFTKLNDVVLVFVDALESSSSSEFCFSLQGADGMSKEATERARLLTVDVVHQLNLTEQIKIALQTRAKAIEVDIWQALESSVDPNLIQKFKGYIL